MIQYNTRKDNAILMCFSKAILLFMTIPCVGGPQRASPVKKFISEWGLIEYPDLDYPVFFSYLVPCSCYKRFNQTSPKTDERKRKYKTYFVTSQIIHGSNALKNYHKRSVHDNQNVTLILIPPYSNKACANSPWNLFSLLFIGRRKAGGEVRRGKELGILLPNPVGQDGTSLKGFFQRFMRSVELNTSLFLPWFIIWIMYHCALLPCTIHLSAANITTWRLNEEMRKYDTGCVWLASCINASSNESTDEWISLKESWKVIKVTQWNDGTCSKPFQVSSRWQKCKRSTEVSVM